MGLVIALLSLAYVSCNRSNGHEGHNHDEDSHDGHDHGDHEGHDHDNDNLEDHDHDDHEGHDHGEESLEGNDHSDEESSHTDEISFTKEQAQMAGLATESIALGTFHQVIKTSGKIQASQGDEATLVATSNGIVSFVNPSIAEGDYVKSGEVIITVSAKQILNGDPVEKA